MIRSTVFALVWFGAVWAMLLLTPRPIRAEHVAKTTGLSAGQLADVDDEGDEDEGDFDEDLDNDYDNYWNNYWGWYHNQYTPYYYNRFYRGMPYESRYPGYWRRNWY